MMPGSDAHGDAIAERHERAVVEQHSGIRIFQADIEPSAIQPAFKAVSAVKPAIEHPCVECDIRPVPIPDQSSEHDRHLLQEEVS